MASFSQRALQTINAFAGQMQMPNVQPALDGSVSFAFEHAGLLTFSPSNDGERAILSLKRKPQRLLSGDELKGVLSLAQRDMTTRLPISAGLSSDGGIIFAANIHDRNFDLQKVEACLDRLIELQSAV